jgi:2-oxoglutarate/2-oxoacid ferredoxin oxidoreductase subunit alpha
VRFAGDSGDGMQLVGGQFADIASIDGQRDLLVPGFPSDIRAPAGTLAASAGIN